MRKGGKEEGVRWRGKEKGGNGVGWRGGGRV